MKTIISYVTHLLIRSKLVVGFIIFTLLVYFLTFKIVATMVVYVENKAQPLSMLLNGNEKTVLPLLSLFWGTGGLFAFVYGMWIVPFAHSTDQALLTFTLPLRRWKFSGAYLVVFMIVLAILLVALHGGFAFLFGAETWVGLPWARLALAFAMETLGLVAGMFLVACLALHFGKSLAFFLSMGFLTLSHVFTFFVAMFDVASGSTELSMTWWQVFHELLPPFSSMQGFFLRQARVGDPDFELFGKWIFWMVLSISVFTYILSRPPKNVTE